MKILKIKKKQLYSQCIEAIVVLMNEIVIFESTEARL